MIKKIGQYNELLCQIAEVEGKRTSPKEKQYVTMSIKSQATSP
jgi:hypothetical protein